MIRDGSEVRRTSQRAVRGEFYESIAEILRTARSNAYRAVNFVMAEAYWNVGRMIVEEEQQGKERAGYGKALIRGLSKRLNQDFGRGFGVSNLFAFRQFYLAMPIFRALRGISGGDGSDREHQACSGSPVANLLAGSAMVIPSYRFRTASSSC